MDNKKIRLIVGLGNVGDAYKGTRHNAGFMFVDAVAEKYSGFFQFQKKFNGELASIRINSDEVLLLKPSTLMNLSGKAVAPLAGFYKIPAEQILVAHDELDLPPGVIKLKKGGGSAGHNGLKSIAALLGTPDFERLRIGIGHPRNKNLPIPVADYVLSKPSVEDRELIEESISRALGALEEIVEGQLSLAMSTINERVDTNK